MRALDGVSLDVARGEMVALVGPSGCGKSTLLNLVGCVDLPTSGSVRVEGAETCDLGDDALTRLRRERVGTVFQFFNLLPAMRIADNVALPLVLQRAASAEIALRVDAVLRDVGLEAKARAFPAQLSAGQLQRAAIARAVVHRPAIVLADEPTGNLDTQTGAVVLKLLRGSRTPARRSSWRRTAPTRRRSAIASCRCATAASSERAVSGLFAALVAGPLRANALRALVTLAAVALAVAIGLAIDLANATAVASFASSVNVVSNRVNLQVLGVGRGFDERALPRVQALAGVVSASPAIEDSLTVGARAGDPLSGEIVRVLGVDLLRPLPGVSTASAPAPDTVAASAVDPWVLVNAHGALVGAATARRLRWRRGATVHALAGDRVVTLRVAGIVPAGTPGIDSSLIFVDVATAQELFGKDRAARPHRRRGRSSALGAGASRRRARDPAGHPRDPAGDAAGRDRADAAQLSAEPGCARLRRTAGRDVLDLQHRGDLGGPAAPGDRHGSRARRDARFGVPHLSGGRRAGRRARIARRARPRRGARNVFGRGGDADGRHDLRRDPRGPRRLRSDPVRQSVRPGRRRVDRRRGDPGARRGARRRRRSRCARKGSSGAGRALAARAALAGAALLALAWACTLFPALDGVPAFGYAAGLLIIFGGSLCAPLAVDLLAHAATGLARAASGARAGGGESGRRAAAHRGRRGGADDRDRDDGRDRRARRIVPHHGRRVGGRDAARRSVRAPARARRRLGRPGFSPSVASGIAKVHGVDEVDTFHAIQVPFRGRLTNVGATNLAILASRRHLRILGAHDTEALVRELTAGGEVLVSEPFATKFGVAPGDRVALPTASGTVALRVAAVYNDYSSDAGFVLMDVRTFRRLYRDDVVDSIAVYAAPGADLPRLRTAIVRAVAPLRIDVETNRELRALVVEIFDRTFAITYALDVVAIAIAVLGVVSTLFALVLERRREFGILRYLGVTTRGVRAIVLAEAAGIGFLGAVLGVAVGMLLALVLVFVVNRQAFGYLIELARPLVVSGRDGRARHRGGGGGGRVSGAGCGADSDG